MNEFKTNLIPGNFFGSVLYYREAKIIHRVVAGGAATLAPNPNPNPNQYVVG